MNKFSAQAIESILALRSTMLVCISLLTTSLVSYINCLKPEVRVLPGHGIPSRLASDSLGFVSVGLEPGSVLVGAHLITPRSFYMHHGIYLGGGEVAHYSGLSSSLKSGPVEVTDLEHFANGKPVWVFQEPYEFSNHEVANRARSRVGERQYKLLSNNCEHFCNWCISGKSYSTQLSAYVRCPGKLLSLVSALDPCFIA
ncbi:lecithin retinol acyltransferase family protein [Pseudomonas sp. EL_65y_Pfl2_R95]|uniref:lecithin retinol acyltransferase family protein n=1 Tax=Pseudomonas sp. EL_65y_Pfl2_R95 TaxID=3088698 RepID=UPI0030D74DAC